jgi:Domain of unknown function (DUF4070)
LPGGDLRGKVGAMELVHRIVTALPEAREPFWRVFMTCARENPNATRIIVALMAMYLHLGPFSRRVIAEIDRRIDADEELSSKAFERGKSSVGACESFNQRQE